MQFCDIKHNFPDVASNPVLTIEVVNISLDLNSLFRDTINVRQVSGSHVYIILLKNYRHDTQHIT
mgnify:CR=1 FL=1